MFRTVNGKLMRAEIQVRVECVLKKLTSTKYLQATVH
jgi:hypothetical protein